MSEIFCSILYFSQSAIYEVEMPEATVVNQVSKAGPASEFWPPIYGSEAKQQCK